VSFLAAVLTGMYLCNACSCHEVSMISRNGRGQRQLRATSPYGSLAGWRLLSFIVKADDDLRQEQIAVQLIGEFDAIFRREQL
jgi:phosphatidylinositol kinase/protein kinase (PI-3  family)